MALQETKSETLPARQATVYFEYHKIIGLNEWIVRSTVTGRTARYFKTERGASKYANNLNAQYNRIAMMEGK